METKAVSARETKTVSWQVTLTVKAKKLVVDKTGTEAKLSKKDWVEIGVYAPAEERKEVGISASK